MYYLEHDVDATLQHNTLRVYLLFIAIYVRFMYELFKKGAALEIYPEIGLLQIACIQLHR